MTPAEVPPWGTPDGDPDPSSRGSGTPDYGTPPPAPGRHGRHLQGRGNPPPPARPSPDPAATGWGTPGSAPELLSAETVIVVEQGGFLSGGGYALLTPDGVPLGSVTQQTSAAGYIFGAAASTTYRVLDPADGLVGAMVRPGTLGRSRFVVTDTVGLEVGTVEQENLIGSPELLLTPLSGRRMRLLGGGFGSREWTLTYVEDDGTQLARVSQVSAGLGGMFNDTQNFAVMLSPALTGGRRLLTLLATICLDHIRDAKKR